MKFTEYDYLAEKYYGEGFIKSHTIKADCDISQRNMRFIKSTNNEFFFTGDTDYLIISNTIDGYKWIKRDEVYNDENYKDIVKMVNVFKKQATNMLKKSKLYETLINRDINQEMISFKGEDENGK